MYIYIYIYICIYMHIYIYIYIYIYTSQMASASDEERIFVAPTPNTNIRGGRRLPWAACRALVWRPGPPPAMGICAMFGARNQHCERCRRQFCPLHVRRVWHREHPDVEEHGEGLGMGWGMGTTACLGRWGACSSGDGSQLRCSAGWHEAVLYHVLHGVPPDRPRSGGAAGTMRRACTSLSLSISLSLYIYGLP